MTLKVLQMNLTKLTEAPEKNIKINEVLCQKIHVVN